MIEFIGVSGAIGAMFMMICVGVNGVLERHLDKHIDDIMKWRRE